MAESIIKEPSPSSPSYGATQIINGIISGSQIADDTITSDQVASSAITAEEIAANTITGDNIAGLDITGKTITADTGTIGGFTLGTNELVGPSGAIIRSQDMTAFGIGSGFWLGNVDGTGKYFFGDQNGDYTSFDGTNIRVSAALEATSVLNTITYATTNLPVAPTAVGFNDPTASESPPSGSFDTGFNFPSATTGTWTNPSNAYAEDGVFATASANKTQYYGSFGLDIPSNATIDGVEVKIKAKASATATLNVSLGSGLIPKEQALTTTNTQYTLGGASDVWGETLTAASFDDAEYPIFIGGTDFGRTYSVDGIQLKVYYTVPAGFTNPDNAFSSNNSYATASASSGVITVELSGDQGSTYSTAINNTYTGSEGGQTYGSGSTELWGLTWLGSNVSDTNFRLKITAGGVSQVYKTFGFAPSASVVLTGIEVSVEAKWVDPTTSIDHVKVKIYYGTSTLPVQAGSLAFSTDASTSGALEVYNGSAWKELVDTSTAQTLTGKTITSPNITTSLLPTTSDGAALGSTTKQWSDLFLAEGGVINWDNGDATLTQVGDVVTLAGADLKISTPGTASTSVATIDGTQTLTNKTISGASNTVSNIGPASRTGGFFAGEVGTANLNSTGDKGITGVGFIPKLVKFTMLRSSSGTVGGGGWGVMTALSQFATAFTSTSANNSSAACMIRVASGSSTLVLSCTFVSMDADGFTFNVGTTSGSEQNWWYECYG